MNDFVADLALAGDRGSMVLVTERRRKFGPLACEGCGRRHDGGSARAVIVQESDDVDAHWLLWMFADGFSRERRIGEWPNRHLRGLSGRARY